MYADTLFRSDAHRDAVSERLFYYLMREASPQEVDRYIEIEARVGHLGDAAVIAAWCREQAESKRLNTVEMRAVGGAVYHRVERKVAAVPRRPRASQRSIA